MPIKFEIRPTILISSLPIISFFFPFMEQTATISPGILSYPINGLPTQYSYFLTLYYFLGKLMLHNSKWFDKCIFEHIPNHLEVFFFKVY